MPSLVSAQIRTDETLGAENSIVTPNIEINGILSDRIDGGAIRGSNLFHSFSELNVAEGHGVYFSNPAGISNIISRVTGGNSSSILGKLGALGHANLFLINPNGIIFGPQASLDLGGSFVATTANAIEFNGQGLFSASEPNIPPLLTVNPSAFIFNRLRPSPISLNSAQEPVGVRYDEIYEETTIFGLQVPNGKSLMLLGGDVNLNNSQINALDGGRVELGGVAEAGIVGLSINGNSFSLNFPSNLALADVSLVQGSRVYTSGDRGGSIQLTGNNIRMIDGSSLAAETFGEQSGENITITARDTLEVSENPANGVYNPSISTVTYGNGDGGDIFIDTKKLLVRDGAQVSNTSVGGGNGGQLVIHALDSVELRGTDTDGGFSGLTGGAVLGGKGGNIIITTKNLTIQDGAIITVESLGDENSNNISDSVATGDSGNITINASNSFLVSGTDTGIASSTSGVGNAGNITINTGLLTIQNGGVITVASYEDGAGKAGNLIINATQAVNLMGADSMLSATGDGLRPAGSLTIKTGNLNVSDGAQMTVDNIKGEAGNLTIDANNLFLDRGFLTAETAETGIDGANINLQLSNLLKMQNESLISAQATGGANGGNVTLNSPLLAVLLPTGPNGSDIIAKAEAGNGGNILINSQGIFGITEGKAIAGNQSNDIDASSEFGAPGRVLINNTIDPNQGTVTLPEDVVAPNTLVAQNACKRGTASQLTQTGRGGLPPTISENLNSQAIAVGLIDPAPSSVSQAENQAIVTQYSSIAQNQIVPAQGWIFNQKGEVMLVAYDPTVTGSQRVKVNPLGCVVP
ncbi:MAG: filamentous hemagglutinin N-terminal domain-containing protein [Snowella sp.]|nr:filamentous hemagglutinin N-terminal domain-containing protein [Snowella sp.]